MQTQKKAIWLYDNMLRTTQPQGFDNMTVDMKKHYIDLKFEDPTNNLRMRYRDSHGKGPPIILLHFYAVGR